jgi:hypothetical protein
MDFRSSSTWLLSVLFVALPVGCGGGPTQAPPPAMGKPAPSAEPAEANAKPTEAKKKTDVEQAHKEFGEACQKETKGAGDYCECAWTQLKKVLGDDLAGKDDPKLAAQVRDHVAHECRAKAPESMVKEGYLDGCMGGRTEMGEYCGCTWAEFRKRYSAGDMGDEKVVQGDGFGAARKDVVKACGPKMPEAVAKEDFMKGCATDDAAKPFCTCAWKETRKLGSPAEIEAGLLDRPKLMATLETACGKLKPKPNGNGAPGAAAPATTGAAPKPAPKAAPKTTK